jgi:hypothetical protein
MLGDIGTSSALLDEAGELFGTKNKSVEAESVTNITDHPICFVVGSREPSFQARRSMMGWINRAIIIRD